MISTVARWPVGSCPECYDAGTPDRPRCTPHGHELLSSGVTICDPHEHGLRSEIGRCGCTIHEDRGEPCGFTGPMQDYCDPLAQVCDTCLRVCWGHER